MCRTTALLFYLDDLRRRKGHAPGLPRSELLESLLDVLASTVDGGAEAEAGAGHQTRNKGGSAGPGGSDGAVCAEKSLSRAADGDAEDRGRRHGESECWRGSW